MAANDIKLLYQGQLPAAAAVLYTAPASAGNRALIKEMTLVNTSLTSRTVELFIGGSASTNKVTKVTLAAGETGEFQGNMVMNNGQTFQGRDGTGPVSSEGITLTVFGMEMT